MSNAINVNTIMQKADLKVMKSFEEALESASAQGDHSRMVRVHGQMSHLVEQMKNRGELEVSEQEPAWHQQARDCSNMVEAIKLVREHTGWGLRESKDWVDAHCGRLKAKQKDAAIERLEEHSERLERDNATLRHELFTIRERIATLYGDDRDDDDENADF